jgi:hypothetical protein
MLYWRNPLKTQCGDKFAMREYVDKNNLGYLLPKLIGVYCNVNEIEFQRLPEKYVLKCTHGSKMNIVCDGKREINNEIAKSQLNAWLTIRYDRVNGELHYAKMKPRIICEEYLDDKSGQFPSDYKIYCFNGQVHCIMVCQNRAIDGRHASYDFYDKDWNRLNYDKNSLNLRVYVEKPCALNEMIQSAEILSKPFPFVRIDYYSINSKAVLGEMTFTPGACLDKDYTDIAQLLLGQLIKLPFKKIL